MFIPRKTKGNEHQIIVCWRDKITRSLLYRGSPFNAESPKSMAPPFPVASSRVTSNREGFGECGERPLFRVCGSRWSLDDQLQRVSSWRWCRASLLQGIASNKGFLLSVRQLVAIIEIGGLKVFVCQRAHTTSNRKEFGEWREPIVSVIGCF